MHSLISMACMTSTRHVHFIKHVAGLIDSKNCFVCIIKTFYCLKKGKEVSIQIVKRQKCGVTNEAMKEVNRILFNERINQVTNPQ